MTYLQFHALFMLPPVLLLAVGLRKALPRLGDRARWALPAMTLIALAYTTPWDNILVWRGVWYYGMDRVVATIGYVPAEEYLFFLLQPLMTGMTFYLFLGRLVEEGHVPPAPEGPARLRLQGAFLWTALAAAGGLLLTETPGTYMGLILVWAAPVLAVLWLYGGEQVVRLRAAAIPSILLPTLYLWIADRVAIKAGVWDISARFSLGFRPLGLPVEEAVFFLMTNVLVVVGTTLFLVPGMHLDRPARIAVAQVV